MALKKFNSEEVLAKVLKDIDDESIMEMCIKCSKEKPIPMIREKKVCDDCLEGEFQRQNEIKANAEREILLMSQRIPKRYWNFDIKLLEGGEEQFDDFAGSEKSVAIGGPPDTGKTNYACQILIRRGNGIFFTSTEIFKEKVDRIKAYPVMAIDDVTKMDFTDRRKMEVFFELLNWRYQENLKTIITHDKTYDEINVLFGDYGAALVRRFRSWMYPLKLKTIWAPKP